jgi:hypothetical protein
MLGKPLSVVRLCVCASVRLCVCASVRLSAYLVPGATYPSITAWA